MTTFKKEFDVSSPLKLYKALEKIEEGDAVLVDTECLTVMKAYPEGYNPETGEFKE